VCGQADLPPAGVTEENWKRVFDANVESVLWLSQAAAPFMQKAGWGRIVVISSGAGLRPSLTGLHAHTSAKHAVIGLTKQLSVGLAQYGITTNSVAPGLIRSNPTTERQWKLMGPRGSAGWWKACTRSDWAKQKTSRPQRCFSQANRRIGSPVRFCLLMVAGPDFRPVASQRLPGSGLIIRASVRHHVDLLP
jgi:NAD(P)-dependent dehydrogenase (short-subunit alcohol dehydrogenase family)